MYYLQQYYHILNYDNYLLREYSNNYGHGSSVLKIFYVYSIFLFSII